MTSDAEIVERCPFCGSDDLEPSFVSGAHELFVSIACCNCQAEGPPVIVKSDNKSGSLAEAHTKWNARSLLSPSTNLKE